VGKHELDTSARHVPKLGTTNARIINRLREMPSERSESREGYLPFQTLSRLANRQVHHKGREDQEARRNQRLLRQTPRRGSPVDRTAGMITRMTLVRCLTIR
jgi:hypothetical protein